MKTTKLCNSVRLLLLAGGLLLIIVLFKPIWRIELSAPQYPEGLTMYIGANGLSGDVQIINGLNHYIGMKTLHNEDFIEFRVLPFLIAAFSLFFFVVGISGKRKLMYALLSVFIIFGVLAMVDFWKWEYSYGHNLDPNAAIIVPGMAYQPPLVGFKQLLNFGAYSVPDIGGWLFIAAGGIILICIFMDARVRRAARLPHKMVATSLAIFSVLHLSSCSNAAEPIKIGVDNCYYCKMTISDNKYGAEVITKKGKIFKFDDTHCLVSEIKEGGIGTSIVGEIYFSDFCTPHSLVKSDHAFYLQSSEMKAPMGGNIAVFGSLDSLNVYKARVGGSEISWSQVLSIR